MFLSKVQQSYCYTQLCNYREKFVYKPISSEVNKISCCNYPKKSTQIYFYDKSIYYFKTYQRRFE